MKEQLAELGGMVLIDSADFGKLIADETRRAKVVKFSGAKPE
jgi:hypothetical protein